MTTYLSTDRKECRFKELVRKRQTLCHSALHHHADHVCRFYSADCLCTGWLGTPLHAGTNVTRGIPIGIGLIVISFLLTGVYVWRANGEFDRLNP